MIRVYKAVELESVMSGVRYVGVWSYCRFYALEDYPVTTKNEFIYIYNNTWRLFRLICDDEALSRLVLHTEVVL